MAYANDYFKAQLISRLAADSAYLPVCDEARADLLRFIPDGGYTYATLMNDATMETVIIRNDHGTLLLERGVGETTAVAHPPGTCVHTVSPTVVAVIKDLICTWKCCEE